MNEFNLIQFNHKLMTLFLYEDCQYIEFVEVFITGDKMTFLIPRGHDLSKYLDNHSIVLSYNDERYMLKIEGKCKKVINDDIENMIQNSSIMKRLYTHKKAYNILDTYELQYSQIEMIDYKEQPITRIEFGKETYAFVVDSSCIYCKACSRVCPQHCIDISIRPVKIDHNHCLMCGKCAEICPRKAIIKTSI